MGDTSSEIGTPSKPDRTQADAHQSHKSNLLRQEVVGKSAKPTRTQADAHQSHKSNLLQQEVVGKSPHVVDAALKILDGLYDGNVEDPRYLRGDRGEAMRDISKAQGSEYAATYGEVLPSGLAQLLTELQAVPGQKFYDLGSGTGKMVFMAWLLGFKAVGVELARERWQASTRILAAALHGQVTTYSGGDASWGIELLRADVATVDFSDADIVIANSPCYPKSLMDAMAKTAERMRPGTHIVTVGGLDSDLLKRNGFIKLETSWNSKGTQFVIQTVLAEKEPEREPRVRRPSAGSLTSGAFCSGRVPGLALMRQQRLSPMARLRQQRPLALAYAMP